jgi:ketopantoate reductase
MFGCHFATLLINTGCKTHLLAIDTDCRSMQLEGLKVSSYTGDLHVQNTSAFDKIEDLPKSNFILLGLKTVCN